VVDKCKTSPALTRIFGFCTVQLYSKLTSVIQPSSWTREKSENTSVACLSIRKPASSSMTVCVTSITTGTAGSATTTESSLSSYSSSSSSSTISSATNSSNSSLDISGVCSSSAR